MTERRGEGRSVTTSAGMGIEWALAATIWAALAVQLGAQTNVPPQPPAPPAVGVTVTVIGTMPLPGVEQPLPEIPSPVQVTTSQDIVDSGALDLSDFLNRRGGGVHVNENQGNPFQPDVNYRGFTASPLLGTPQGLSVFMDGVRLNQPFGEVVSWDLIPRAAIATTVLIPGSNPLFGLNTLGGALSIQTKDGRSAPGTRVEGFGGSGLRRALEAEHGGSRESGLSWYATANLFAEDGWRDDSPSTVRQLFGKLGWQRATHQLFWSAAHADNSLTGNGVQDTRFLERDYASIYTKPDVTDNRSTLLTLSSREDLGRGLTFAGNAYYRRIRTTTLNGDINEDSLAQSLYQPGTAERAALAAAGYGNVPASGLTAANTPFPSLRCIGNVLLRDEPGEKCNGLLNRGRSRQQTGGGSLQLTLERPLAQRSNRLTIGTAFERSGVSFQQSSELGYLNPDRSITGLGAFADGITGGDVDGEPLDTRVDLTGHVQTWSAYGSDTLALGSRAHLTVSGRYNRTTVHNRDQIAPGGGPGSLDGDHVFSRFNPAAGITFAPRPGLRLYSGYSEGSRAATSIELGCADPEEPCKLPNAMAGDPPLRQVVARTVEAGVSGTWRSFDLQAGLFRIGNRDDILFVTSEQTGFGYFKNFGRTRRAGLELGAGRHFGRVGAGAHYTLLQATYQSAETLNGEGNSTNDAAEEGRKGLEGTIQVEPGDRLPLVPRHLFKIYGDVRVTAALSLDLDLVAVSGSFARGNENNLHQPDGVYYLGPGGSSGYGIVNLSARYALPHRIELTLRVNNLLNHHYATSSLLGSAGFSDGGTFVARGFPAIDGEFPVRQTTFLAPGAPIQIWAGARWRF